MLAEALEPNRGIEAFHVGIVGRLAWAAEVQRDAVRIGRSHGSENRSSHPCWGQRISISRADDADGADANPAFVSGESLLWRLASLPGLGDRFGSQ